MACAKADGILEWHNAILERMNRVHAIVIMEENVGVKNSYYHWLLVQLHKQKISAESDYRKAEDRVRLAWTRVMNFGTRMS